MTEITTPADTSTALRILLIDDEAEILAAVGALLRKMGYDVITAADGA
jgi:CheY-like chemotaxis protein|tara:strand:+ start:516 stop:659 length:144 start_codon:yes stop_codon:yes gene_type:complete